ncbi:MAG: hypothetical protein HC882_00720 [Acidobacteria bacterium]|nr:hypothetical protein [Acidobacteriota bacterium]
MSKPTLVAKFLLDSHGAPQVAYRGDPAHYRIELAVTNAPADTYAVTYELHESYYEPVRESRRRGDQFSEEITSYGDYEVRATVRGKARSQVVVAELSEALRRGHGRNPSPALAKALRDIESN